MLEMSDRIEACGYRAKAYLHNKVYIFRDDEEMAVIPLDELVNKTTEETRAIIERYFEEMEEH